MSEFFLVLFAIHFGGIAGGLIAAVFVATLPVFSRMWKPIHVAKSTVCLFITIAIMPIFYFHVYNQNLLWTMYTYTAIIYGTIAIATLVFTPGEFFEELKVAVIALPLACLTNLIYVYALQGWAMGLFNPTPHFPFMYKMIIIALMLAIGGVAFVNRKK